MEIRQAYDLWASQYDSNLNKTRDLEAVALQQSLTELPFNNCLEIGCGTGKNTLWLLTRTAQITAVDLSDEMLAKAKSKISSPDVEFVQADINGAWAFTSKQYDLITFSLVLEHIGQLDHVFREASGLLKTGGYVYIGELHPFKQYAGTRARFDTADGQQTVQCFNHNVSDFTQTAKQYGLAVADLNEYFDDDDRNTIPRILSLVLKKF